MLSDFDSIGSVSTSFHVGASDYSTSGSQLVAQSKADPNLILSSLARALGASDSGPTISVTSATTVFRQASDFALFQTVKKLLVEDDVSSLRSLLDSRAVGDTFFREALFEAAANNAALCSGFFIQSGVSPDIQDVQGNTPLHVAVRSGHLSVARALIHAAKAISIEVFRSLLSCRGALDRTPLEWAAVCGNLEMVELLIVSGAPLTEPLTKLAATRGDFECFCLLRDSNALIDSSLFVSACLGGSLPLVQELHRAGAFDTDLISDQILIDLIHRDNCDVLRFLYTSLGFDVSKSFFNGRTAAHIASFRGLFSTLEMLIALGVDPTLEDSEGHNCLDLAVIGGRDRIALILTGFGMDPTISQVVFAVKNGMTGFLSFAIDFGFSVDTIDPESDCPLIMIAAQYGSVPCVRFLGERGAKLCARGRNNECALLAAVRMGVKSIVQTMLDLGSQCQAVDSVGNTVVHIAATFHDHQMLRLLCQHQLDLNTRNSQGFTPLLSAIHSGSLMSVRELLLFGCDSSVAGDDGRTPLVMAIDSHNPQIQDLLKSFTDLHRLAASGTPEQIAEAVRDGRGTVCDLLLPFYQTPLLIAAEFGMLENCATFLALGADVYHKDRDMHSAADLAGPNFSECHRLLLDWEQNQGLRRIRHRSTPRVPSRGSTRSLASDADRSPAEIGIPFQPSFVIVSDNDSDSVSIDLQLESSLLLSESVPRFGAGQSPQSRDSCELSDSRLDCTTTSFMMTDAVSVISAYISESLTHVAFRDAGDSIFGSSIDSDSDSESMIDIPPSGMSTGMGMTPTHHLESVHGLPFNLDRQFGLMTRLLSDWDGMADPPIVLLQFVATHCCCSVCKRFVRPSQIRYLCSSGHGACLDCLPTVDHHCPFTGCRLLRAVPYAVHSAQGFENALLDRPRVIDASISPDTLRGVFEGRTIQVVGTSRHLRARHMNSIEQLFQHPGLLSPFAIIQLEVDSLVHSVAIVDDLVPLSQCYLDISPTSALRFCKCIADALSFLLDYNICHGAVHPDNVFIRIGGDDVACLAGLCSSRDPSAICPAIVFQQFCRLIIAILFRDLSLFDSDFNSEDLSIALSGLGVHESVSCVLTETVTSSHPFARFDELLVHLSTSLVP